MTTSFSDLREIQTFRFQTHTNEINFIFQNKKSIMGFCVIESIDWQDWAIQPISHELKITAISKQVGRFLFNKKEWRSVRNLFKGQIFMLKSKTNHEIS